MQIPLYSRRPEQKVTAHIFTFVALLFAVTLMSIFVSNPIAAKTQAPDTYEIYVHAGKVEDSIEFFKSRDFWGPESHEKDLDVPRIILVVASKRWEEESKKIPVQDKKEIFYRAIIPMILYANDLISRDRKALEMLLVTINEKKSFNQDQAAFLKKISEKYAMEEATDTAIHIQKLLNRVDVVPASLALGQAAYESGYGTSRFAVEGNALFGQWTYGGDGMKPKEHRSEKGNYGVAAYKWPFDSVRSYMHNLNTHSAYKELRDMRVKLRQKGVKPTGLDLAETLVKYSEKGKEYVETLKSIITVNGLSIVDNAYLREEPVTLLVGVAGEKKIGETESQIEQLRKSGELDRVIQSMQLGNL
jgi:uncharacterized FlgJ-related protein